jgi:hypothetical protein
MITGPLMWAALLLLIDRMFGNQQRRDRKFAKAHRYG